MIKTSNSPHAHWRALPPGSLTLNGGLWSQRQAINRQISLRHGYNMLESAGNFHDLRLAAGRIEGTYRGPLFMDSDLYKWLEAVAWEIANNPDSELQRMLDETVELIEAAQTPEGYLNSYYQIVEPDRRWVNLKDGHELYCFGHLTHAAVAHHRVTGDDRLLNVARRFADYIDSVFGPGKRPVTDGHPESEMALIELYRETGERRYLDLALFILEQRGHNLLGANHNAGYYQDRVPIKQSKIVEGHAVRALYLAAGVTDAYIETGDEAWLNTVRAQWRDFTGCKMFITGGAGSRHDGESFGQPYELPNDRCYCETCAAIASVLWNWRMLLTTGESRFADLIERTLYNGFLSGVSLDGRGFFYVNPLMSRGGYTRPEWHGCACCPPNVMRMLSSITHYFATADDSSIQIHQYAPGALETGEISLQIETLFPWEGVVKFTVDKSPAAAWALKLRIPGWSDSTTLKINGENTEFPSAQNGYVTIERAWNSGDTVEIDFAMSPRLSEAHPRIDPTRGSLAIERGPLVYCLEQIDNAADISDVEINPAAPLQTEWQPDLMGGTMLIKAEGNVVDTSDWEGTLYRTSGRHEAKKQPVQLIAAPYQLWSNRDSGAMRVWIPRAK